MFKLIQLAIARIIQAMGGATSTQPAGHVPQGHTTRTGKVPSVLVGINHQPLHVQSKPKRKTKVAQPTSAVKSRKAAPKPAQTIPGKLGQLSKTLAPQTQLPAPTKRKLTQEAVPSTTVAPKLGKKKPTARQVATVSQSKPTGSKSKTPALKTHQHVK
jgi:hypothetical protein